MEHSRKKVILEPCSCLLSAGKILKNTQNQDKNIIFLKIPKELGKILGEIQKNIQEEEEEKRPFLILEEKLKRILKIWENAPES